MSNSLSLKLTDKVAVLLDHVVTSTRERAPAGTRTSRHSIAREALERGLNAMARKAMREAASK